VYRIKPMFSAKLVVLHQRLVGHGKRFLFNCKQRDGGFEHNIVTLTKRNQPQKTFALIVVQGKILNAILVKIVTVKNALLFENFENLLLIQ
jgi:hypothetical protein